MTYIDKPAVPNVVKFDEPTTIKRDKLSVMLNTGSDIYQGACKKRGSTLKDEYRHVSGTAYMDPKDMAKLEVKNWDVAIVKTDWGEVVVYVAHSRDAPHEGQIFICKGPWANVVVSPETYCCCDPTYKGVPATIEKTNEQPLLMADLMAEVYKKYNDNETSTGNRLVKLPNNNASNYRS
ncbi:MAG: formylmethanofuran dehydrogenase [Methanobrevibacter sp.]|nr:formylmethanofuran dehydrogenase [Candidatus Methanovirga basalitermitum]